MQNHADLFDVAGAAAEPVVIGQGPVDLLQHCRRDPLRKCEIKLWNASF